MIKRIRLPSTWLPSDDTGRRYATAEFKLGVDPCGKVVQELDISYGPHDITVYQVCRCGEEKHFVYPRDTISGRIEVEYGVDLGDDIPGDFLSDNAGVPIG